MEPRTSAVVFSSLSETSDLFVNEEFTIQPIIDPRKPSKKEDPVVEEVKQPTTEDTSSLDDEEFEEFVKQLRAERGRK